jgi:hypothetical protein
MHFNVREVFYSLNSHQHVSTAISAIFKVILLQEYKSTNVVVFVILYFLASLPLLVGILNILSVLYILIYILNHIF